MHEQTTPRRWKRLAVASTFVAAAVVGSLAGAAPAGAATVSPNDVGGCTFGSSAGNTQTCINVHQPANTATVTGSATIINDARKLQICLNTPVGIKCNPSVGFKLVSPGGSISVSLTITNPPPGTYCANTWRANADGTKTQIGHICVVHM